MNQGAKILEQSLGVLNIASRDDVQALRAWIGFFRTAQIHTVTIQLSELDANEARYWETRIKRMLNACGCHVGGVLALTTLIAYILASMRTASDSTRSAWEVAGVGFGLVIVATLVGKLGGLITARIFLRRDLGLLLNRLSHHLNTQNEKEG